MGGFLRTVIIVDQQTYFLSTYTSEMVRFVAHDKFMEADRAYIQQFIAEHREDTADDACFAPEGYGLDVFDFDNKRVFTGQGGTEYREVQYPKIGLAIMSGEREFPETVRRMLEKKYVGVLEVTGKHGQYYKNGNYRIVFPTVSYREVLSQMEKFAGIRDHEHYPYYNSFPIRWTENGWQYKDYGNSASLQMFNDLQVLYSFTDAERTVWAQHIEDHG